MTAYNFGDVVLVPFPFTNQTASKKRPAVVISSEQYNVERPDIIIMAVSSQIGPESTVAEATVKNWQAAGLLKPSVMKSILTTIEKGLVLKNLGRLAKEDRQALQGMLQKIIGKESAS